MHMERSKQVESVGNVRLVRFTPQKKVATDFCSRANSDDIGAKQKKRRE